MARSKALALSVLVGLFASACAGSFGTADRPAVPAPREAPVAAEPQASASTVADRTALGQSATIAANGTSADDGLRRGAAAVDSVSAGTIVAHALTDSVVARDEPNEDAEVIEQFEHPTERGGPLVFQAIGRSEDGWLQVLLPVRPNGTTGWIPLSSVELTINPYRIEVDASAYELTVFRYGSEQMRTTIAIGNGATPTPIGDFYLIELLRPTNPGGVYGPFAYGLSGYSDTLQSFNGGEGVIGIHGTNQPNLLGQDVSHGCIRVANPTIAEMTEFLPLGTPVSIFRTPEQESATPDVADQPESP